MREEDTALILLWRDFCGSLSIYFFILPVKNRGFYAMIEKFCARSIIC